uniref:Uncharacterized protein n=1 Tax=viral metagenome TaxID=1070528 RepID=A0A6M3KXD4_9ZZZZ
MGVRRGVNLPLNWDKEKEEYFKKHPIKNGIEKNQAKCLVIKELREISQFIQMLGTREGEENNPEHWGELQKYISDKIKKHED